MEKKQFNLVNQKNKVYFYVDKLSNQVVGSFLSADDKLLVKRWLMTLTFDALEKSKFNLGALAVFIQREIWSLNLNDMSLTYEYDLKDFVDEAVGSLQDTSKVIKVKDTVHIVNEREKS